MRLDGPHEVDEDLFEYRQRGNVTVDNRGANTITLTIGPEGSIRTAAISGGPTVNYTYNALGKRVIRVEGATTTHFDSVPLPELGGEHRAKPVLQEPVDLVTDVYTALGQQVLDLQQRTRATDASSTVRRITSGELLK